MEQITMNIDLALKRQAEAMLEVYGESMEAFFEICLKNFVNSGEMPCATEEFSLSAEEDALLDKAIAEHYTETEEEFFESLDRACKDMDEGKGIPFDVVMRELYGKYFPEVDYDSL